MGTLFSKSLFPDECLEHSTSGTQTQLTLGDLEVELQAFGTMLISRLVNAHPEALFRPAFELFDGIELADADLWVEHVYKKDGKNYLRLDCLQDTQSPP